MDHLFTCLRHCVWPSTLEEEINSLNTNFKQPRVDIALKSSNCTLNVLSENENVQCFMSWWFDVSDPTWEAIAVSSEK